MLKKYDTLSDMRLSYHMPLSISVKINDLEEMLAETCLLRVWNTLKWLGFSVYK